MEKQTAIDFLQSVLTPGMTLQFERLAFERIPHEDAVVWRFTYRIMANGVNISHPVAFACVDEQINQYTPVSWTPTAYQGKTLAMLATANARSITEIIGQVLGFSSTGFSYQEKIV